MYGVHQCYHCKSVPNRSEPAGAASVPWPWQCSSTSGSPFLSPPSALGAKRVHHVRAVYSVITAALVLTCGYSATCGVYLHVHVHLSQTQKSGTIAASSSLSITTLSRQFALQPIGHFVAVFPFARYPRVGSSSLFVLLGHQGESTMHARRRLTLAQCGTGLSTATLLV